MRDMKEFTVTDLATAVATGTKKWYFNGQLHREDGPAIEYANGDKEWRDNGVLHREDGPAKEFANGTKEWWVDGVMHRQELVNPSLDGKVIEIDGNKYKLNKI